MRKLLPVLLTLCLLSNSYAAPCYGTKLPAKNGFFLGTQDYSLIKRDLEDDQGRLRSSQYFLLVSYGVFDWLSIDLKGGAGNVIQHPESGDKMGYASNFAGGYGFRLRFYDRQNIKMVFGFQHISVHPKNRDLGIDKQRAILDDWQVSILGSYDFKKITPYLGARWSRVDYIHRNGEDRKRVMSDLNKDIGLIAGFDLPINKKLWLNLEGQFLDSEAFAVSLNYSF